VFGVNPVTVQTVPAIAEQPTTPTLAPPEIVEYFVVYVVAPVTDGYTIFTDDDDAADALIKLKVGATGLHVMSDEFKDVPPELLADTE
jgi:hypothetical protein